MNDKYKALKNTTDWIVNSSSEEFMSTFKLLGDDYSGITVGEFIDSFIDNSEHNYIEYDILTTGNFVFGAKEQVVNKKQEWIPVSIEEKDRRFRNDDIYTFSLAA